MEGRGRRRENNKINKIKGGEGFPSFYIPAGNGEVCKKQVGSPWGSGHFKQR